MLNWIVLAVDHMPLLGLEQPPYEANIMGKRLIDLAMDQLKGLGASPYCIESYPQSLEWSDASGEDVVMLLDGAVYVRGTTFFEMVSERVRHLNNEHIVYRVAERPVALMIKVKQLQKVWALVGPSDERPRCLTKLVNALESLFEDRREDYIDSNSAVLVDDLVSMQRVIQIVKEQKIASLLMSGVMIMDPNHTYVDLTVNIHPKTVIYPGSFIEGHTTIEESCVIGPAARIVDSVIGKHVKIKDSTVIESKIDDFSSVGPYAYLRPNSDIGKGVKIGDFVEVKNARIDDGAKVSHLSYIGDGHVGKEVNIGCGVVFVNYDGVSKHKTVVEDHAFVGCNVNLVAPVTVKQGAYVAAGSTITEDVDSDSLAIARSRQVVKKNWVSNKKTR
jgi:UDP-N-acetylglucosamine diphosphorylase/glucosamine-1-phosphate N-acetyltransferase